MQKNRVKRFILFFSLCFVAGNGLGHALVYTAILGIVLSLLVLESYPERPKNLFTCIAVLTAISLEPSLGHSASLLAILLIVTGHRSLAASFLFSQLPTLISPFLPCPSWGVLSPFLGIGLMVAATIFFLFFPRFLRWGFTGICMIYGILLIFTTCSSWNLSPVPGRNVAPGYQIGSALEKITGKPGTGAGQLVYNNTEYQKVTLAGTLYLDHDAYTDWDDGNFYQGRPWSRNLIMAGEPWRMAVQRDGILISNIGSALKQDSYHPLYGQMDGFTVVPLALNEQDKLILADSDFVVNGMAPYQSSLIRRITGTDSGFLAFHIICSLILFILPWYVCPWLPLFPVLAYLCAVWWPIQGEIRYIGNHHYWPHTELGEGIVRHLQDCGMNVIFGSVGTKLLVVGSDYTASWKNEKIIILEPGAKVKIKGTIYEAQDVPMGEWDGILDARSILKNGEKQPSPIIKLEQVTIIATGSPTTLETQYFRSLL